jgi:hypothetical protein
LCVYMQGAREHRLLLAVRRLEGWATAEKKKEDSNGGTTKVEKKRKRAPPDNEAGDDDDEDAMETNVDVVESCRTTLLAMEVKTDERGSGERGMSRTWNAELPADACTHCWAAGGADQAAGREQPRVQGQRGAAGGPPPYNDGKVANRETRIWHFGIENDY